MEIIFAALLTIGGAYMLVALSIVLNSLIQEKR